ncbi:MAG: 2-hydroxychromene-2-carboxylate isomerase [Labilithrix sp.]|nr:2-hydroxychromene-2-carboxylate isomerase [Labilithrix sp.]
MQAFENGRTLPAKSLDFWFDYTCPYAYLGSTQARALAARMGVSLTYRPLLLGGVFRANETPQKLFATLAPPKAAHNMDDMQRWAKRFGVSLTMPPDHPIRSVEALRATLVTGIDPRVVDAFFRAYWVDNADISSREVIAKVVSSCGHDSDLVLAAIDTQCVKDVLRERTDEAIALGIFGVPAWVVDDAHLYWGQDRIEFVEGLSRPVHVPVPVPDLALDSPPTLEVFWDFSSPFAYLGATQIDALARRTGARVTWRPLLLGGLFRSIGTPDVPIATFSDAKKRYILKDLDRWAAYWGVPFRFPSRFPANSLRALRVYCALPEERRAAYRDAVFRACWAEDRDITDDAVLGSCIGDESAARDALARANSDEVKSELRRATEHAAERGVFGVPTFVVGRELFWGQDRLDLVEEALSR